MAMLSFLLLPRTFSQLPSAVCQFKVSVEVELSRLPTLSAVMENSEQNLPAPAINEEYAENSTVSRQIKEEYSEAETISRQIKKEAVFVLVPKLDVQNKVGFSRVIKNSGQAMTRDEMREDRRRRRSGEVWEEVKVKEEYSETGGGSLVGELVQEERLKEENSETGATLGGDPVAAEGGEVE